MKTLDTLLNYPWMNTLLGCVLLLLLAWLAFVLTRYLLKRGTRLISQHTAWTWDDALVRRRVFHHLAQVVPLLVIQYGLLLIPGVPDRVEQAVARIVTALVVIIVARAAGAALSALDDLYQGTPRGRERSIKGYIQLVKIVLYLIAAIVIIAMLAGRSPWTLLAGLGAVSAVLLLIFKDTILSVVASIQIGTNDMVRVGDWIAMPEDNVDGDVVEIALHTVKVVNWDKTLSTVPTWHLISRSFRNYRHMYETGRRIRRAINIDLTSVRFLTKDEIDHLRKFKLLDGYFERKQEELSKWNAEQGEPGKLAMNQRRLSNLGSFRAYVQAYVDAHPGVNQQLFWAVRQLDPGPTGIPLQVYAYTRNTGFVAHHNVKDDIFEHLIAILPEFGLSLFQQPSGADMRAGLAALEQLAQQPA